MDFFSYIYIVNEFDDWDITLVNSKLFEIVQESEGNSSTSYWWKVSLLCCGEEIGSKREIFLIVGSTPTYFTI